MNDFKYSYAVQIHTTLQSTVVIATIAAAEISYHLVKASRLEANKQHEITIYCFSLSALTYGNKF